MKTTLTFLCVVALLFSFSIPIPRQEGAKPAEPAKTEKPKPPETDAATLEFLKKVDEVHYNFPAAGVHSLVFKLKIGGNPMMPPEAREKMKDAALAYYWQEEPWKEAIDVLGLPPEMAAMKGAYLGKGIAGMRQMIAHSATLLAKHCSVAMSKDGDLTKLEWTPKEGEKEFTPFVQWYDRNTKFVRGQMTSAKDKKTTNYEVALVPLGTKYAIAEIKQAAAEGGNVSHIEWGKQGELHVPAKLVTSSGPMKLEFPLELEPNAKIDPAVFEKKP